MPARIVLLLCLASLVSETMFAQSVTCELKPPFFHMHFGSGDVRDANTVAMTLYERVQSSCPTDGHYAFTSSTSGCFRGDWHTLTEDHTPGDANGNMLLVNSAYESGVFFSSRVQGFKSATTYQFSVWLMNVCRPSDKCPYPLLPNLTILLQTPAGKTVAKFATGDVPRLPSPHWTEHRAQFTVPPATTELVLVFINNAPGGCGNDLALDDITFRECVKKDPPQVVQAKKTPPPVAAEKKKATVKKEVKKEKPVQASVKISNSIVVVAKSQKAMPVNDKPVTTLPAKLLPAPAVLQQRTTTLAKQIEAGAGMIQLDLYDNGEIDGDTVSIYHNNQLIVSQQRLSNKPISFRIQVDKNQPHHELVMVANNLGSIPPNTSLMIVTTNDKRYQVFISSTEQQNAKVAIDLKEE